MASITITIPDAFVGRVLDGMVPVAPETGTKAQAAKAMLIEYIKTTVRNAESEAAKAAQVAATETAIAGIN